jgi:hydroxyacylglutathione hydrolase
LAAVCDPIDEPELYLRTAEESGMKIRYVVDTHVHADHISGGRRLADITGARYVLHANCGAEYEFFPVRDGDNLDLLFGAELTHVYALNHGSRMETN